jgi:glucose-6-phosphate 1-dehydrogenase
MVLKLPSSPQVKPEEEEKYEEFWKLNNYVAGSYNKRVDFEMLNQALSHHENGTAANRLFYLALPPSVFEDVTVLIRNACMGEK